MIVTIKKGWEFDLIFRTGIRANGELVRLLFLRQEGIQNNEIRVGFAVGKHQGKAHVRNRGKRILRAAFRQLNKNFELKPGISFILSLRNKGLGAKSGDIFLDLVKILKLKKLLSEF